MNYYSFITLILIIGFLAAGCSGEQQNSEMHSEQMEEGTALQLCRRERTCAMITGSS